MGTTLLSKVQMRIHVEHIATHKTLYKYNSVIIIIVMRFEKEYMSLFECNLLGV